MGGNAMKHIDARLAAMGRTNIFAVYKEDRETRERLVCRLDGAVRPFGSEFIFVPVEDFVTGERFEPRMDLLHLVNEMEVLAWAASR